MVKALKGTQDILPGDIERWNRVEDISRRTFSRYCYKEIRTPIIEETDLFVRSVGGETDIVTKQMYSFTDRGNRKISLRPEETAAVVRAYLEHNIHRTVGFAKFFYMGPMFRSERPQAGRMRQFHQVGVEAIGAYSPYLDAEIILLLNDLLRSYGLKGYRFKLNSLGCKKDKSKLRGILTKGLQCNASALCGDCQARYQTNILRILDCKKSSCQNIVRPLASSLNKVLCTGCAGDFRSVQDILSEAKLGYDISPFLVRGLDYYTKTVFEVTTEHLGAHDAVAAGGRYDNLISDFGGPAIGACGFAIGIERVLEVLKKVQPETVVTSSSRPIYVATHGEKALVEGFKILSKLRDAGLSAEIDYQQKSLKAQLRLADRLKARHVVILGEDEIKEKAALLKDMENGRQIKISMFGLIEELRKKIK